MGLHFLKATSLLVEVCQVFYKIKSFPCSLPHKFKIDQLLFSVLRLTHRITRDVNKAGSFKAKAKIKAKSLKAKAKSLKAKAKAKARSLKTKAKARGQG